MFGVAQLICKTAPPFLLDESFKTISILFPLPIESINSLVTVYHCMKINKRVVNLLNPCQVSVTAEGNVSKSL